MPRAPLRRRIAIFALATGLSLCITGPLGSAAAALSQEERRGEAIAEAVRTGESRCADLSATEYELIGEYAMGHYLGSVATHSAMNVRMTRTMGEFGDQRMHLALGHRYSGCSGGPTSGWIGPVAGMMAGRRTGGTAPGMMGGGEIGGRDHHPRSTMGSSGHGDIEISVLGGVLIAVGSAALGAGAAALMSGRRRQPDRTPRAEP